ncbi:MAG: leucine-rich repeat domain-containing protein [Schaedlerella sp.]|nr:leucine-rich repeat domain-containing protein [Schaedlerella sp.]
MKIQYRKIENEIEIVRCFGIEPLIVLPERIDNLPVTKVAAYTFSARKWEEDQDVFEYHTEDDFLTGREQHLLAGMEVQEVVFPDSVEKIGNYIFYGCKVLKRIEFSDALMDIGSGAFTGCDRLSKLDVHLYNDEKSCVKEILGDLWQRIDVSFYYEGDNKKVDLVFPEHYEEAVENTPARILFTQHHGSGNNYRQCFTAKTVDYRKYDELFYVARVYDKIELLTDLAFSRLMSEKNLTEKSKAAYESYILEEMQNILQSLIQYRKDESKSFVYLQEISKRKLWKLETIDLAVQLSAAQGNQELSAWLMNERYKLAEGIDAGKPSKLKRKKFAL